MRTRNAALAAAATLLAATGGGAVAAVAVTAADGPGTASCTAAPPVEEVDEGSRITVECTVPRQATATVTETVTAPPGPSPTSTSPSPTTPPPPVTGWPGPTTTGVPADVSLRPSGSVTVTRTGAVVDGLDITGSLTIRADNVTVKNTRVRSNTFWGVTIGEGVDNALLQDVEVDGRGETEGASGIVGPATIVRADVHGFENGIVPGSGSVITGSWIHDLRSPGSPHYDGIQIDGSRSGITISGNHVDLTEHDQTAAVMVDNYYGPVSNVTVDRNLLRGGGYTMYADGKFTSASLLGLVYTNNRLTRGAYGYALVRLASVIWAGNVDHTTGRPILSPG